MEEGPSITPPDLASDPAGPSSSVSPAWILVTAEEAGVDDAANPKVLDFGELNAELERLRILSSELRKAKEQRAERAARIEAFLEVRRKATEQSFELKQIEHKFAAYKASIKDLAVRREKMLEDVVAKKEQLVFNIKTLSKAANVLSSAHRNLQDSDKLLNGENGRGCLRNLAKTLRMRQQYMVAQVAALYPVKPSNEQAHVEMRKYSDAGDDGDAETTSLNGSQTVRPSSFTIFGLTLPKLPMKMASYLFDRKEFIKSATVLGYVAHAVSLIASYIDVPLRYPVRLGGSHSYIIDNAQFESTSMEALMDTVSHLGKPAEFPLFFESQEMTRAIYAVFLLNKDLEQLLNCVGAESLGPRHVLPNLRELMRIIQSEEFVNS